MEDIKINFSSNHSSIISKYILGMTYYRTKDYLYNKNTNIINFKKEEGKIDISLFAHLLKHKDTIKSISHEFLHYILHKTIGIAVCAQYDNIAYKYYKQEDIAYGVVDLEENEEKEIVKLELGIDKVRIRS